MSKYANTIAHIDHGKTSLMKAILRQAFSHPSVPLCMHCDQPSVTMLDGEFLCQEHANEWVRGEGMAAAEMDEAPL